MLSIVDTGPLFAVADIDDAAHESCLDVLGNPELQLVIPALVVAEACYLIGTRLGATAEAAFLRSLTLFDVEAPSPDDWSRIAELVEQYGDFPLGGTDASVVALAERLNSEVVITLDRRHFGAVQPRHRQAFRILP